MERIWFTVLKEVGADVETSSMTGGKQEEVQKADRQVSISTPSLDLASIIRYLNHSPSARLLYPVEVVQVAGSEHHCSIPVSARATTSTLPTTQSLEVLLLQIDMWLF